MAADGYRANDDDLKRLVLRRRRRADEMTQRHPPRRASVEKPLMPRHLGGFAIVIV